jgi:class 3 adenylate cyclase
MWPWRARPRTENELVYRLLLAVDVEKYSRLDAQQQLKVQIELHRLINASASRAGLATNGWYRQPSGDGELVAFPADTDILRTVGTFTRTLERGLARLNERRSAEPRLRLRVAFHHGTMIPGPLGPAGDAPIVVGRLLDAAPLRDYLTDHQDRDLALVVSDSLYNDVIRTGLCELNPRRFIEVNVEIKQVHYRGYIHHDTRALAPLGRDER